jgi:hypothetical protein
MKIYKARLIGMLSENKRKPKGANPLALLLTKIDKYTFCTQFEVKPKTIKSLEGTSLAPYIS